MATLLAQQPHPYKHLFFLCSSGSLDDVVTDPGTPWEKFPGYRPVCIHTAHASIYTGVVGLISAFKPGVGADVQLVPFEDIRNHPLVRAITF